MIGRKTTNATAPVEPSIGEKRKRISDYFKQKQSKQGE